MPYSEDWDENLPTGNMDARTADDFLRSKQTATRERLCDILGGMNLAEWQADPILPKGLRLNGQPDVSVIGGTSTTRITNDDEDDDFIIDHANRVVRASRLKGLGDAPVVSITGGNLTVENARGWDLNGKIELNKPGSPTSTVCRVTFDRAFALPPTVICNVWQNDSLFVASPLPYVCRALAGYFEIILADTDMVADGFVFIDYIAMASS